MGVTCGTWTPRPSRASSARGERPQNWNCASSLYRVLHDHNDQCWRRIMSTHRKHQNLRITTLSPAAPLCRPVIRSLNGPIRPVPSQDACMPSHGHGLSLVSCSGHCNGRWRESSFLTCKWQLPFHYHESHAWVICIIVEWRPNNCLFCTLAWISE